MTQALTALVEVVAAVVIAFASYPGYLRALAGYDAARVHVDTAGSFVLGATVFLGFFFTGRGILSLVLFGEGLVRLLGAAAGIEVGTIGGFLWRKARGVRGRSDAPLPEDIVTLEGERLTIESAVPRLVELTNVLTHDGRDWICERVEAAQTRAHRYVLRPLRDGDIVRKRVSFERSRRER